MADGSGEPEKGTEELCTANEDPVTGGCQPKGIGDFFQGVGTGSADFRVRDMGAYPLHGTSPGNFSTWGCAADNGKTAKEIGRGGLVITTSIGRNGGGGI